MSFVWTDIIIERVAKLMTDGLSAGEIAQELGVTRNSVIGKVTRDKRLNTIGLRGRSGVKKSTKFKTPAIAKSKDKKFQAVNIVRKKASRERDRKPIAPNTVISTFEYEQDCKRLAIHELGKQECRWPVNDAAVGEPHLFCGKRTDEAKSYCSHHAHKSFGPGTRSERMSVAKAEYIARQA